MRIDWLTSKITLEQFELFLGSYLGDIYDGLLFENNKVTIVTDEQITADQETYILDWLDSVNNKPKEVIVSNVPTVTTQYELNDKDLKLARAYAVVDETHKATLSLKIPGTFGVNGRYITGGYATTEDYDKDDFALVWVSDDDRMVAMAVALAMNPEATEPLPDEVIQGMGVIPGFNIAMPLYPVVKNYYDDDADIDNQGWYFWPVSQGSNLEPVGETEVETLAGFAFIPSGFYLKIQYNRVSKTTGGIRINLFWGRKG